MAGPPNFFASDFVIFQKLASLSVRSFQTGIASLEEGVSSEQQEQSTAKINVFAATYESGQPMQGPVTVLLKEFPPQSRHMGLNELTMLTSVQARCSRAVPAVLV